MWIFLSSDSTRVLIFLLLTGLLYSAFQLCILSEVRLLNFLRQLLLDCYPYFLEIKKKADIFFEEILGGPKVGGNLKPLEKASQIVYEVFKVDVGFPVFFGGC